VLGRFVEEAEGFLVEDGFFVELGFLVEEGFEVGLWVELGFLVVVTRFVEEEVCFEVVCLRN